MLQAHLTAARSVDERAVTWKAAARLVPSLCLLYFIAYLDRVNVGFAALTMREDLGLSAAAYGLAAGIFFVGYFLFEVPSNLLLERFGARRWIARIMVSWGLVSIGMAFVRGPASFYALRLLLGVAEAGFFPGVVLYLTRWFPGRARAAVLGWFILANPLTSVVGAPISTALLQTRLPGLAGWQTLFILEGLPAVLLGCAVPFWLCAMCLASVKLGARPRSVEPALGRDRRARPASGASGARRRGGVRCRCHDRPRLSCDRVLRARRRGDLCGVAGFLDAACGPARRDGGSGRDRADQLDRHAVRIHRPRSHREPQGGDGRLRGRIDSRGGEPRRSGRAELCSWLRGFGGWQLVEAARRERGCVRPLVEPVMGQFGGSTG